MAKREATDLNGMIAAKLADLGPEQQAALAAALGDRCIDVRRGGAIVRLRANVAEQRVQVANDYKERAAALLTLSDDDGAALHEVVDVQADTKQDALRDRLAEVWLAVCGQVKPSLKATKTGTTPKRKQLLPSWSLGAQGGPPDKAELEPPPDSIGDTEDATRQSSQSQTSSQRFAGTDASPTILVIGAGVTGLTAAQELVERGLNVVVVERATSSLDRNVTAVGGVARTPYVHLPHALVGSNHTTFVAARPPLLLQTDFFSGRFTMEADGAVPGAGTPALGEAVAGAFRLLLERVKGEVSPGDAVPPAGAPVPWVICCVGRFGPNDDPGKAMERTQRLRTWLVNTAIASAPAVLTVGTRSTAADTPPMGPMRPDDPVITLSDPGDASQTARFRFVAEIRISPDAAAMNNQAETVVELHVGQYLVPSEHGYRVFPGFYRHMFDTMKRIPLVDEAGRATGYSAFDNLVAVNEVQMYRYRNTGAEREPHTFPRRPARSIEELRQMFRDLRKFGFEDRDITLFEVRMLKYLTSCRKRRASEAEGKHWQEYIGIEDFMRKGKDTRFSEALRDAPLSLLAARADQVDARTHLNTAAQLFLDHVRSDRTSDMTLNGPTSEALFTPWKRYLRSQGVKFFRGELDQISSMWGELSPKWKTAPVADRACDSFPDRYDYVVLAIDLSEIFKVLERSPHRDRFRGDLQTLLLWKEKTDREIDDEKDRQKRKGQEPDPSFDFVSIGAVGPQEPTTAEPDIERWVPTGPFRTMAGVQYYFESGVRVGGKGHVYYIGAPWGVSSISQPSYWRTRMQRQDAGFISNLSVDLCNWYNDQMPTENDDRMGDRAEGMTRKRSALETLELPARIWDQLTHPLPHWTKENLAKPHWVNIDWNLERKSATDPTTPIVRNNAPYLINRPEDNASRPTFQRDPGDPEAPALPPVEHGSERGLAYRMTQGNWVIAGNHMPTMTRLTSMEAANESAKHAVNALLYDIAQKRDQLMGEFCDTSNPEDNELADLESLKRLDDRLMARNLPHVFEILRLEKSIILSPTEAYEHLDNFITDAFRTIQDDGGPMSGLTDWETLVKNLLTKGQNLFKQGGSIW
ncbi:hypothetical protein LBMAG42_27760 [Deltaproteobacteria bacterium]|nr:hypothetical protein LBMAG42_27760 [Deltaproteobacteria bacterium]